MKISTISPAYGRDYKTQKEVQAAFDAEKDFVIEDYMHPYSGKYVNKQQLSEQDTVGIRYDRKTKYMIVRVK